MIIATSQDVILIGCCSCHPSACDAPRKECESLLGTVTFDGFYDDGIDPPDRYVTAYKHLHQEYSGGRYYDYVWNSLIIVYLGGKEVSDPRVRTDTDGGTDATLPITNTYSDGATFAATVPEMVSILESSLDWDDTEMTKGDDCFAFRVEQNSPVIGPVDFKLSFSRYKIGIPEAWADFSGRHATWVTDHATWVAADPDTRGPEPVEPVERTVFECQWDEYFFPPEWDEWKALKDEFAATTAAHDAWAACEALTPGDCGDEPTISATPGDEPTAPSLVTHQSWSYGGTDEFSDWFEIAVPEAKGQTRVVNMLVKCYHSTRLGVKPTASGEVYNP